MRILLIGNGLDLNFQENLSRSMIKKNILESRETYKGKPGDFLAYPFSLKTLWNLVNDNGTEYPFSGKPENIIKKILNTESDDSSIEDIYADVFNELVEFNKEKEWRLFFINYLKHFSGLIDKKYIKNIGTDWLKTEEGYDYNNGNINPITDKLNDYDLILTTNYDNLIDELAFRLNDRVGHIHGDFATMDENNPLKKLLLGNEKKNDTEYYKKYIKNRINLVFDAYEEWIGHDFQLRIYDKDGNIDFSPIAIDIYGWSFDNDKLLLDFVLRCIFKRVTKMLTKPDGDRFYKKDEVSSIVRKIFRLNYYSYSNADDNKFKMNLEKGLYNCWLWLYKNWVSYNIQDGPYRYSFKSEKEDEETEAFTACIPAYLYNSNDFFKNKNDESVIWDSKIDYQGNLLDKYDIIALVAKEKEKLSHISVSDDGYKEVLRRYDELKHSLDRFNN